MEKIEHEIKIDDNIIVKMNIPKVLTAIELKALMHKANKLFNLSEVTIVDTKRKYVSRNKKDYTKIDDLIHKGHTISKIAKKMGMSNQGVSNRKYALKKKGEL